MAPQSHTLRGEHGGASGTVNLGDCSTSPHAPNVTSGSSSGMASGVVPTDHDSTDGMAKMNLDGSSDNLPLTKLRDLQHRYNGPIKQQNSIPGAALPISGGSSVPPSAWTLFSGLSMHARPIEQRNGTPGIALSASDGYSITPAFARLTTSHSHVSPPSSAATTRTPESHNTSVPRLPSDGSPGRSSQTSSLSSSQNSPIASPRLVSKQSRLPLSTVGRKAPRKSSYAPTQSVNNTQKVLKRRNVPTTARVRSSNSELGDAHLSPAPGRKILKEAALRTTQRSSTVALPAGSKKASASRNTDRSIANSKPIQNEDDIISSSAESTGSYNEPRKESSAPPMITRGQSQAQKRDTPSQSSHEYGIPPEICGVVRALGQDDWSEYMKAAEKYVSKQITEVEFSTIGRRMFYVIDGKMRKRIQSIVVSMVEQSVGE